MSTPEQAAWDSLRPVMLGCGLDPKRVENVVGPGHPDVNYAGGDIELKAMPEGFPPRALKIKIPEYSGEQAGWLYKRWQAGGLAWLMVRVRTGWFLFDGFTAMDVWRGMSPVSWIDRAAMFYPGRIVGGLAWGSYPPNASGAHPYAHPYSKQLRDWLRFDLDAMMPGARARAMRVRAMKTPDEVSRDLGWSAMAVAEIESGSVSPHGDINDLLDYWNN